MSRQAGPGGAHRKLGEARTALAGRAPTGCGPSGQRGSGVSGSQENRQPAMTAIGGRSSTSPRTTVDFAVPFSPRTSTPPTAGETALSSSASLRSSIPTTELKGYIVTAPVLGPPPCAAAPADPADPVDPADPADPAATAASGMPFHPYPGPAPEGAVRSAAGVSWLPDQCSPRLPAATRQWRRGGLLPGHSCATAPTRPGSSLTSPVSQHDTSAGFDGPGWPRRDGRVVDEVNVDRVRTECHFISTFGSGAP